MQEEVKEGRVVDGDNGPKASHLGCSTCFQG